MRFVTQVATKGLTATVERPGQEGHGAPLCLPSHSCSGVNGTRAGRVPPLPLGASPSFLACSPLRDRACQAFPPTVSTGRPCWWPAQRGAIRSGLWSQGFLFLSLLSTARGREISELPIPGKELFQVPFGHVPPPGHPTRSSCHLCTYFNVSTATY